MADKDVDKCGDQDGDQEVDQDLDQEGLHDGDKDGDKGHSKQEKCWGIIAINERGEAYVQAFKEGDDIHADEFKEPEFKRKKPKKKIQKLVEAINEKKLFVEVNELVLSTTEEDYHDQKHQLETLMVAQKGPTEVIPLPKESNDPIRETLRLKNIPLPVEKSIVQKKREIFEENPDPSMIQKNSTGQDNQFITAHAVVPKASPVPPPRRDSSASTHSKTEEKGTGFISSISSFLKKKNDDQTQEIVTGHSDPSTDNNDADTKKDKDIHIAIDSLKEELMSKLEQLETIEHKNSKKIDGLVSVVNGVVTKIETMEASLLKLEGPQKYSPSQRKAAPPTPFKQTTRGLPCYFPPAPSRSKHIQDQFSSKLHQKLAQENLQIVEETTGPTVVFSVNASRMISDIQRDLKADTSNGPIFLLVIKATMKPETETERIEPRSLGFDRVKEAAFLLVDTNNKHLHDCTTNVESLKSVIHFLKQYK